MPDGFEMNEVETRAELKQSILQKAFSGDLTSNFGPIFQPTLEAVVVD